MTVSLLGGPLDGATTEGLSHLPVYMIAYNHKEKPIYKRMCCLNCNCKSENVPYLFIGYESCSAIKAANPDSIQES